MTPPACSEVSASWTLRLAKAADSAMACVESRDEIERQQDSHDLGAGADAEDLAEPEREVDRSDQVRRQ